MSLPVSGWGPVEGGKTIGTAGSERGVILRGEEHAEGARITLERTNQAPFAITCGVYGWMVHTRFFGQYPEAESEYDAMKAELGRLARLVPLQDDPRVDEKSRAVVAAIGAFIERFP